MKKLTLKDLAVDHDYYCSDSNYHSRNAALTYYSFDEFLEDFDGADVDMNLVFRWDLKQIENSDDYELCMYMIKQRKGIFQPIEVSLFEESDIDNFIKYIEKHAEKLRDIWKPFNLY